MTGRNDRNAVVGGAVQGILLGIHIQSDLAIRVHGGSHFQNQPQILKLDGRRGNSVFWRRRMARPMRW